MIALPSYESSFPLYSKCISTRQVGWWTCFPIQKRLHLSTALLRFSTPCLLHRISGNRLHAWWQRNHYPIPWFHRHHSDRAFWFSCHSRHRYSTSSWWSQYTISASAVQAELLQIEYKYTVLNFSVSYAIIMLKPIGTKAIAFIMMVQIYEELLIPQNV